MVYHLTNVVWLGPHRVIFCRPYQKVVARKKLIFQRKFSWHVETAQKEELISTKGSTTTQFMKKYILRNINRCDNGLPFEECGLVWTAQGNIPPSIPENCCPEDFHRKFNPHVDTARKEQLI